MPLERDHSFEPQAAEPASVADIDRRFSLPAFIIRKLRARDARVVIERLHAEIAAHGAGSSPRADVARSVTTSSGVASPDLPDADIEPVPQQRPQRRPILVPDARGDVVHAGAARLQEMNRALDAQRLEIRQR